MFTGRIRTTCSLSNQLGFTLIELLAVVATICLLMGLLLPCVGIAKRSMRRVQTKAQLNHYIAALELYRQDHGQYPDFITQEGYTNLADTSQAFIEALSEEYYTFQASEVNTNGRIVDAFNNSQIYIVADVNHLGIIEALGQNIRAPLVMYTQSGDMIKSWE